MRLTEILLIAVGLSMDAFAVSICKGLVLQKVSIKNMLTVGLYFGIFQALMPVIGYAIGLQFKQVIESYDHWVAFILLIIIGGKMIKESFDKEGGDTKNASMPLAFKKMIVLAVATSIDALAIGVTFAFLKANITLSAVIIGVSTLIISMAGVKLGNIFGLKYKSKAELFGGIILVLIGVKILLEHLEIINF